MDGPNPSHPLRHTDEHTAPLRRRLFMTLRLHRSCYPAAVDAIGRTRWAIAEGYIPGRSHGPAPEMESHEACCILNAGDTAANISITLYFEEREPAGPYRFVVDARRTKHQRFNALTDPEPVPRDTPYSSVIESDVPVVVQHTRLDSRQAENALMTTIAFAAE